MSPEKKKQKTMSQSASANDMMRVPVPPSRMSTAQFGAPAARASKAVRRSEARSGPASNKTWWSLRRQGAAQFGLPGEAAEMFDDSVLVWCRSRLTLALDLCSTCKQPLPDAAADRLELRCCDLCLLDVHAGDACALTSVCVQCGAGVCVDCTMVLGFFAVPCPCGACFMCRAQHPDVHATHVRECAYAMQALPKKVADLGMPPLEEFWRLSAKIRGVNLDQVMQRVEYGAATNADQQKV